MQKKYFGLLLVLCMILAVLPFVLSAGAADSGTEVTVADSAPTVYVKESVETSGDGLSAETAFKTLTKAYTALQATGGTIVICDTVTLTNTSGLYELSVDDDYQYYVASQCGDAVKITSIASTAEDGTVTYPGVLAISEFVLRSDHIFENITISPATSGASISANGNDLTIGENVECTTFDSNYPLLISGMFLVNSNTYLYYADDTLVWADTQEKWANRSDSYFAGKHQDKMTKGTDGDNIQDIVVNSGTWTSIRGGNYRQNSDAAYLELDHVLNITVNGGTVSGVVDSVDSNIQSGALVQAFSTENGSANMTINGGIFEKGALYLFGRSGANNSEEIAGTHTLTINGGTFGVAATPFGIAGVQRRGGGYTVSDPFGESGDTHRTITGSGSVLITGGTFTNAHIRVTAADDADLSNVTTGNSTLLKNGGSLSVVVGESVRDAIVADSGVASATAKTLIHTTDAFTVAGDTENDVVTYECTCGGTGHVSTIATIPTASLKTDIYVSANGATTISGTNFATLGTKANPFGSFDAAMQYAAVVASTGADVKVNVVGEVSVDGYTQLSVYSGSSTFDMYAMPTYSAGSITITGGTLTIGGNNSNFGFALNGELSFENITLQCNQAVHIIAQNYSLVMGTGIQMIGKNVFVYGGCLGSNVYLDGGVSGTVPTTVNSNVTIRSGTYRFVTAGVRHNTSALTAFNGMLTLGAQAAGDTLTITYVAPFSYDAGTLGIVNDVVVNAYAKVIVDGSLENTHWFVDRFRGNANENGGTYNVDLILLADISSNFNIAVRSKDMSVKATVNYNIYYDTRKNGTEGDAQLFSEKASGTPHSVTDNNGVVRSVTLNVNTSTYETYCGDANLGGGHTCTNGSCTRCGKNLHTDLGCQTWGVVTPATCTATGVGQYTCNYCQNIVTANVEIPKITGHTFKATKSDNAVVYTCTDCETEITTVTPTATNIYVSASGITACDEVDDWKALGTTAQLAFGSFDNAMQYAAAVAHSDAEAKVTVHVSGTVALDNYATNLATYGDAVYETYIAPAYAGSITVTGDGSGTLTADPTNANANKVAFALNGDLSFADIKLQADNAKYLYIAAQNHTLVMDQGITTESGVYIFGGHLGGDLFTSDVKDVDRSAAPTTSTGNITVRSGAYHFVTPGDFQGSLETYELTEVNHTMTLGAKDGDTLTITYITPFSYNGGALKTGVAEAKAKVVVDGPMTVSCWFAERYYGEANSNGRYSVDLLLLADITHDTDWIIPSENVPSSEAMSLVGTNNVVNYTIYRDTRITATEADANAFEQSYTGQVLSDSTVTKQVTLNTTQSTYETYCGDANLGGGHPGYEEGKCTRCGACEHSVVDRTYQTLVPDIAPTCTATGVGHYTCNYCQETVTENVTIEKDLTNHVDQNFIAKGSQGSVIYTCEGCGVTTRLTPSGTAVYVSENGIDKFTAVTETLGTTANEAFKDFRCAMQYAAVLATSGVTVTLHVDGKVNIPSNYASPTYTGMLVITGDDTGTLNFEGSRTETTVDSVTTVTESPRRYFANGNVTFEHLTFTTTNPCDLTSGHGTKIYAQNNVLIMGEGLKMGNVDAEGKPTTLSTSSNNYPPVNSVKMYVYGGFAKPTPDDLANPTAGKRMSTNVTVRSGDYWFVGGWNSNVAYEYNEENTGDITNDSTSGGTTDAGNDLNNYPASGKGQITIGKTKAEDYLFTSFLVAYSTGEQRLSTAYDDTVVTILIDGEVDVRALYYLPLNEVRDDAENSINYTDRTYRTRIVFKKGCDLNVEANDNTIGPVEILGLKSLIGKNTMLGVYIDERDPNAIQAAFRFDASISDASGSVAVDTTIANMKSTHALNRSTYVKYCAEFLSDNDHIGMSDLNGCGVCNECGYVHHESELLWRAVDDGYIYGCATCGHSDTFVTCGCSDFAACTHNDHSACTSKHAAPFVYVDGSGYDLYTTLTKPENGTAPTQKDANGNVIDTTSYAIPSGTATYAGNLSAIESVLSIEDYYTEEILTAISYNANDLNKIGNNDANGLTLDTAALTIKEAVRRMRNTGGTVYFSDMYAITSTAITAAHTATITYSSAKVGDSFLGGIVVPPDGNGDALSLSGPTVLENLKIDTIGQCYYWDDSAEMYKYTDVIFIISAHWNDLTIGEGMSTLGSAYIVAGANHNDTKYTSIYADCYSGWDESTHAYTNPTETYPVLASGTTKWDYTNAGLTAGMRNQDVDTVDKTGENAVDIILNGVTHREDTVKAKTAPFYRTIFLGERMASKTEPFYLANKMVRATLTDVICDTLYMASTSDAVTNLSSASDGEGENGDSKTDEGVDTVDESTGADPTETYQYTAIQMVNCGAEVTLAGSTTFRALRTGAENTNTGDAYLESLVLTFAGSSNTYKVTGGYGNSVDGVNLAESNSNNAMNLFNVKNINITVNDRVGVAGAKVLWPRINVSLTSNYKNGLADNTAKITYSAHSVAMYPRFNEGYRTVDRVYTDHTYILRPDTVPATLGNTTDCDYYCSVCGKMMGEKISPIVIKVKRQTFSGDTATVRVYLVKKSNVDWEDEPFEGLSFNLTTPDGFTLTGVTLQKANVTARGTGLSDDAKFTLTYDASTQKMTLCAPDGQQGYFTNQDEALHLATLTYKVTDKAAVKLSDDNGYWATDLQVWKANDDIDILGEIVNTAAVKEYTQPMGLGLTLLSEYILRYNIPLAPANSTDGSVTHNWMKFAVTDYDPETTDPTVHIVEAYEKDNTYYRFEVPAIAAKEMNDKIEGTYYYCNASDCIVYMSDVKERNLLTYCDRMLGNSSNPYLTSMFQAMYNYGAAAQTFFDYNLVGDAEDSHSGLVNLKLAEASRKTYSESDKGALLTENAKTYSKVDVEGQKYTVAGQDAVLDQCITLNVMFNLPEGVTETELSELTFKASYWNINGFQQFAVSGLKTGTATDGNTYLCVPIDQVAAKDLRCLVTGALYDADGNQVSQTVKTSFECYANQVFETSTQEKLVAKIGGTKLRELESVVLATLAYSDAANAYFLNQKNAQ